MPKRITFSLQEGGSIVRASLEYASRSRWRCGDDDRGWSWTETAISLFTLGTWADKDRVLELMKRDLVAEEVNPRFDLRCFNPTDLRSDTPFGRIYLKNGEVVQDIEHPRKQAPCTHPK